MKKTQRPPRFMCVVRGTQWLARFQRAANDVMVHKDFDRVILVLIVVSSVTLAMDDPREDDNAFQEVTGYFFTIAFCCEAAVKLSALGYHYFRNGWVTRAAW